MIVVDASVAIKWAVREPGHEAALAVAESGVPLTAPGILIPEVVNVLRKKVRRGEIDPEQGRQAVRRIADTIDDFVDVGPLAELVFDLAKGLDHAAYDCCYLACALRLRVPLVTSDQVLEAKAARTGCEAMGPEVWLASHAR